MFKNYLLTAWRNFIRDRMFSVINIAGLALGFAACLLIFIFVWAELNYDQWIDNSEQVYRLESTYTVNGRGPLPTATIPAKTGPAVLKDYGQYIADFARIVPQQQSVKVGDQLFNEQVVFVDKSFLDIFSLEFVQGNPVTAFSTSLSLVINETMAQKYFGDKDPVGQVMSVFNAGSVRDYAVSAVVKDIPDQSHMVGEIFALIDEEAMEAAAPGVMTNWFFPSTFTYLKLKRGADIAALKASFPDFADRYDIVPKVASYANVKPRDYFSLHLINVQDIHLDDRVPTDMKAHGSITTIYAFSGIAILLLVIGSINFINLSTAKALKRAREVALRKTLGASRQQLVAQFMMEAFLTVILAALLALGIVEMMLPMYNEMLNQSLTLNSILTPFGLMVFGFFVSVVAIVSGAYPAFFVSKARPGEVLHSNKSGSDGADWIRSALVTFQFAISISLLVSTWLLYEQTRYVLGLDLGYETDNIGVLNVPFSTQSHDQSKALKTEIERLSGVTEVGLSGGIPVFPAFATFAVFSDAVDSTDSVSMPFVAAGYGYFETYGITPIAGRLLSEDYGADMLPIRPGETGEFKGNVIVNQAALKRIGYPKAADAIGKVLRISQPNNITNQMTIVGVVPDIHFGNARQPTQPMIFYYYPPFIGTVSFKMEQGFESQIQEQVGQIWRRLSPENPMNLQFIEDMQAAQYDDDRRQGYLLAAFSVLTVAVAGFGLYGLAAFMAARRTREVGIRKVLGANNFSIIRLFVWSMSKPILAANIIAWPVAWYFMNEWLSTFTYRIDMSLFPFILSGVVVSVFGIVTVAGRTYRVARTHPAKALRVD